MTITAPTPLPPAPGALTGRLGQVRALLAEATAINLPALDAAELLHAVSALEAVRRQIEALDAEVITATQADGTWATTGARTYTAWYRNATGRYRTTAARHVRQARLLRDTLPATARALAAGEISADHVAALTRHAVDTPARRAQLHDPQTGEAFLVDHARVLDAGAFLNLVKHWAIRTDPDAADKTFKDDAERQELVVAPTLDGYHLQGWLTTTNGQALLTALDARTGTPAATDTRTTAQRRADSLTSLAHLSLDAGVLRPGARIRPHLTVTVPYDTLRRLIEASPRPASTCGDTTRLSIHPLATAPATIPGGLDHAHLTGTEPATLPDGTPLAPALLARLACQGAFHRVVFGPDSEVLDVGREHRLFTAAQTRAIIARDRHCQYPGCDAPPGEGEIHHSIWWYDQHGPTNTNLGILLCWYHHDYTHRREITIHRTDDSWHFTRPDATPITPPTGPPCSPRPLTAPPRPSAHRPDAPFASRPPTAPAPAAWAPAGRQQPDP